MECDLRFDNEIWVVMLRMGLWADICRKVRIGGDVEDGIVDWYLSKVSDWRLEVMLRMDCGLIFVGRFWLEFVELGNGCPKSLKFFCSFSFLEMFVQIAVTYEQLAASRTYIADVSIQVSAGSISKGFNKLSASYDLVVRSDKGDAHIREDEETMLGFHFLWCI